MTNLDNQRLKRILFVTTTTHVGGAEKILAAIAEHLRRKGVIVAVCSLKPKGPYGFQLESLSIPVYSFEMSGNSGLSGFLSYVCCMPKLIRQIRIFRPQVLHAFLFRANLLARIAARLCRVPVNISSIRIIENERPFYFLLDRLTSSLVTQHLAVSEQVKEVTCERSKIKTEKIRVIPNGIDISTCQSTHHSKLGDYLTSHLGITPDSLVCGTVARLHRQKGIRNLIEAFALLRTEFPRLKLLIVGEGPERAGLEKQVAELGVSRDVFFAGEINPPTECLKLMNVFILPSLYEGFPNVLLEAMAAQVPVVASNVGGVNELVSQNENGLLFPPGDSRSLADAVRWLLLHPEKAKEMVASAHDRVQKEFSLEGMLKEYDDVYESLLKEVRV